MTQSTPWDVQAIQQRLPHRHPFLLVDRVLAIDDERIRALKNVTINEEFFVGHFPGKPIMPAVLILEGMAQAVGLLHQQTHPSQIGYLVGVDKARFRRQVSPGDQLIYEGELIRQRQALCQAQVKATVDGLLTAEATISLIADDGS